MENGCAIFTENRIVFRRETVGLKRNQVYRGMYSEKKHFGNIYYHEREFDPKSDQNYDLSMTMLCIQGILNREEPVFYMDPTKFYGDLPWFGDTCPKSVSEFCRYYAETRELDFLQTASSMGETLQYFAKYFNGIVLYNEKDMDSRVVALNLAMLNDCIPLSEYNYNLFKQCVKDAPVLKRIDCSMYSRRRVYDWMLKEVFPLCNRNGACSLGFESHKQDGEQYFSYYFMGLDYAVMRKNPIFVVSCNEMERGTGDFIVDGSAEEYGIFEDIMRALDEPAALMGWQEPEWRWALTATRFGHFVFCTDWASNLSFHAAVPLLRPMPFQPKCKPRTDAPKNKVYISIQTNEGDTPKMVSQLYNNGWLCKRRGDYPINWVYNPTITDHFPAMMEYYYATATENDYFSMGPNGAGYNNVRENLHLEKFLEYTHKVNSNVNLTEMDLWYANKKQVEQYFEELPELDGIAIEPHTAVPNGEVFTLNGKTVIRYPDRLYYWLAKEEFCHQRDLKINEEKLMGYLNELYGDGTKPVFVPIYGCESLLVDHFADFVDKLDKNKFEIVDYGTLFHYAAQVAKPMDHHHDEVNPQCVWTDECLKNESLWYAYDGKALFEVVEDGLKVTIPENADLYTGGFRGDMLSSTLRDGQYSAMVAVKGVVLPEGVTKITLGTSRMSKGCDWMFWMYGDYDGFGILDKWEPFWKPLWPGDRYEEVPLRLQNYHPKASDYLILCVEGKPGDSIVFNKVQFR